MDKHLLLGCAFFLVHIFQAQSRAFTEEDCPGNYIPITESFNVSSI